MYEHEKHFFSDITETDVHQFVDFSAGMGPSEENESCSQGIWFNLQVLVISEE